MCLLDVVQRGGVRGREQPRRHQEQVVHGTRRTDAEMVERHDYRAAAGEIVGHAPTVEAVDPQVKVGGGATSAGQAVDKQRPRSGPCCRRPAQPAAQHVRNRHANGV